MKTISYTKRPTAGVYFAGVLICYECGCKYSPKWDYRHRSKNRLIETGEPVELAYPSYRCHNALKNMGCKSKNISHSKLEDSFLEYISKYGELTADDIEQAEETDQPDHNAEIRTVTAEIATIERKTKEIMNMFMSGGLEFSEYQTMSKVGNERRKILEERLDQLHKIQEHKRVRYSKAEIITNLLENWKVMDNNQRQQFTQKFIKKIVVKAEPPTAGRFNRVIIDDILFNEF
jgi:hypothetical protein